jgi:hypothetical protein
MRLHRFLDKLDCPSIAAVIYRKIDLRHNEVLNQIVMIVLTETFVAFFNKVSSD